MNLSFLNSRRSGRQALAPQIFTFLGSNCLDETYLGGQFAWSLTYDSFHRHVSLPPCRYYFLRFSPDSWLACSLTSAVGWATFTILVACHLRLCFLSWSQYFIFVDRLTTLSRVDWLWRHSKRCLHSVYLLGFLTHGGPGFLTSIFCS